MIFTVAIDGPAAAGKGTIARAIARETGFAHLDTGLLYRAVGLRVLEGDDPVRAARSLDPTSLDDPRLRHADVAQTASRVAVLPEVRAALLEFQRTFARREGGAVLDGRDIGTVICPEAEVKLFVTASDLARASRRYDELRAAGQEVTLDGTLEEVRARDARDGARATAPLRAASDAVAIDTSDLKVDDAVAAALSVVRRRLAGA
ncbi:(d)CMP kinase [Rubellimicrobium rubrum]|uniref:Cytidylate kinase n=1 Tax=Rubellimicrobium rubrum TaxID=2585369 RepID=A0A5C4MVD1_9RHOB|nr:d(CMP) kinase [Rubellimicrobium rubrum]TNC48954.1 (d)CMP kinase [Rubellimicrobium rubrum]